MAKIVQGQHGSGRRQSRVLAFNPAFVVKSPVMLRLRASLNLVKVSAATAGSNRDDARRQLGRR
jgi:hypothetical protein